MTRNEQEAFDRYGLSALWDYQAEHADPLPPVAPPTPELKTKITNWLKSQETKTMKLSDMFPGNFLKAADLQGKSVVVTIEGFSEEEMQDGAKKWVLHFVGKDRGLVLNKTNATRLFEFAGADSDAWAGQKIRLIATKVDFRGDLVDAIRIHPVDPPLQAPQDEDDSPF